METICTTTVEEIVIIKNSKKVDRIHISISLAIVEWFGTQNCRLSTVSKCSQFKWQSEKKL